MKIRKKSKQEQGITLIALVVTIIVLLILAGVTISAVLGENGLVQKAKQATQVHQNAVITENNQMNNASNFINTLANNDSQADEEDEGEWWMPTEAELAELQAANAAVLNIFFIAGSDTQNTTTSNYSQGKNTIVIARETGNIWSVVFGDGTENEDYFCYLSQKDLRSNITEIEEAKQEGSEVNENFLTVLKATTQVPVWIKDYSYSISYECPFDLDEIKYYASESYYNRVMSHIRSAVANPVQL